MSSTCRATWCIACATTSSGSIAGSGERSLRPLAAEKPRPQLAQPVAPGKIARMAGPPRGAVLAGADLALRAPRTVVIHRDTLARVALRKAVRIGLAVERV